MTSPSVGIVLPVRDAGDLLPAWLHAVDGQVRELGARLVVVDDASRDETASVVRRAGVELICLDQRVGPYVARNRGWQQLDTEVVVFLDVRCRPRSGAIAAMVATLQDPAVVIAGAEVVSVGTGGPAVRWAVADQPVSLRWHLDDPYLPFVPTAAMAVRRRDLVTLGGFAPDRSAGDADLCWRAQLAGLGSVTAAPGAVLEAVPRRTVAEVLVQARRWGWAHVALWQRYVEHGHRLPPPKSRRAQLRRALATARHSWSGSRDLGVTVVRVRRQWAYESAYRTAYRRRRSG